MGTATTGGLDRSSLERQWANYEARQKLSSKDRALWDASRHTVRPHVYYDKVLIAWTLVQGEPQVKEVFKVVGIDVSLQDGIWLRLYAEIAKRDVTLTHTPRRMLPELDIIAWVPYFNELRFASADWDDPDAKRSLRLSACFKTRDRSNSLIEGQDFLSELHVFRDMWPQYANTRF